MQAKSPTRITLALDIVKRLQSGPFAGYHELGIVKHQIDLCDTISICKSDQTRIECAHPHVPCDSGNICFKVAELLRQRRGIADSVTITIEKRIPVMGGLAGGSANAATVLALLNRWWELKLSQQELMDIGRGVGMDVPFYFVGGTAFDTESTGELRRLATNLVFDFVVAVIEPGVSTAQAYGQIDYTAIGQQRDRTSRLIQSLETNDRSGVIAGIHNDFELSVFKTRPDIAAVRDRALALGAQAAWMTGSGSTVIAVAQNRADAESIAQSLKGTLSVVDSFAVGSWQQGSEFAG